MHATYSMNSFSPLLILILENIQLSIAPFVQVFLSKFTKVIIVCYANFPNLIFALF